MRIEHLALWVRDLERMRIFYETYFGAVANDKYVNASKQFASYFLTFPGGGARLELMHNPAVAKSGLLRSDELKVGLSHFAMQIGDEAAVDALTVKLRKDGYLIAGEPRRTGDGYYESVVLDPEGNRIEITA